MERKKIFLVVEEKNGKGKGGPYLEEANISWGEKKMEKETEENNWIREIYFVYGEKDKEKELNMWSAEDRGLFFYFYKIGLEDKFFLNKKGGVFLCS